MRFEKTFLFFVMLFFACVPTAWCLDSQTAPEAAEASSLSLDEIIDRVEARYAVAGFSADFFQTSTLKAMEITDTASGKIFVKRPGMMRWEYRLPDEQIIVSDGKQLMIYRPADRQVMIGKAPIFFGGGKGAGFLSDLHRLRSRFLITLESRRIDGDYLLKLLPIEKAYDISLISLVISAKTFDISRIVTYNAYNDETRIDLSDIRSEPELDDLLFTFPIPEGVEVLYLDE